MRALLLLLVGLVLIGGLLVAADLVVTATAEERLGERVSRALDAPAEAELHGWPVTAYFLAGSVPRVEIAARDVPLGQGGAAIDRLDVDLRDVAVRWADLTGDADDLPQAGQATFEARVDESTAQAMLGLPDEIVGIELRDGVMVLNFAGLAQVDADVEAVDGIIVVRPRGGIAGLVGLAEIPIDLREQPGGPHVQEADVRDGGIVLSGTLAEVSSTEDG